MRLTLIDELLKTSAARLPESRRAIVPYGWEYDFNVSVEETQASFTHARDGSANNDGGVMVQALVHLAKKEWDKAICCIESMRSRPKGKRGKG